MNVLIYQASKSATQSGRAHQKNWIIEPVEKGIKAPDPMMGVSGCAGTNAQVKMNFPSRAAAERFADKKGWRYETEAGHTRKITPRNYGDNFRYVPMDE